MTVLICFDTEGELSDLTELNHEDLHKNGFNLDNWDWGFVTNQKFEQDESPQFTKQILNMMGNKYKCIEYDNKYYYLNIIKK